MTITSILLDLLLLVLVGLALMFRRAVWRFGRVLWVCRVSFVSAVGGGTLLAATPQARDCFSDLGLFWWQWFVFLALTFLWAWIVHASARRALLADDWVPEAHCAAGLSDERRQELQELYEWPALWVPRLLGLSVLIFVMIAIYVARDNLKGATGGLLEADEAVRQINWLGAGMLVVTALYVGLIWTRRTVRKTLRRVRFAVGGAPPAPVAPDPENEAPLLMGVLPVPLSWWRTNLHAVAASLLASVEWGLSVVAALITVFFIYAFASPHAGAEWLPRVLVVPVLFGGLVLLLGEVGMWSMRLRTPFLLLVVLLGCVFQFRAEHFHDIRFVDAQTKSSSPMRGASPQIHFEEAVARWRQVNGDCDPDAKDETKKCPRPILIAGAGGASRAAFMTATVVGAMIDAGINAPETYGNVRNRIFAMSTVSGSSLGAVVMRAALADAGASTDPDQPPCRQETGDRAWFRHRLAAGVTPAYDSFKGSWRDCFQVLLAGDFLSPVVVGLFYRDNFPLETWGNAWWGDRAALLEEAFERRYAEVTGRGRVECSDNDFTYGLCRPFGYHPPPGEKKTWLPLLYVNGTSVWTGRRIIAADTPMGDCGGRIVRPMFPYDYDAREYLSPKKLGSCPPPPDGSGALNGVVDVANRGQNADIRLSTAATISARFPLISPQGNFRGAKAERTDEVVDGGYFENNGLGTIGDVAAALHYQYRLDPVVLRIDNDPDETTDAPKPHSGPLPRDGEVEDRVWFDDFISIVRTLISIRTAHVDGLEDFVKDVLAGPERLIRIGVYHTLDSTDMPVGANVKNPLCRWEARPHQAGEEPQKTIMKNVSMSWWMSHPEQAFVDAQLCKPDNSQKLLCELEAGRQGGTKSCSAAVAAK